MKENVPVGKLGRIFAVFVAKSFGKNKKNHPNGDVNIKIWFHSVIDNYDTTPLPMWSDLITRQLFVKFGGDE